MNIQIPCYKKTDIKEFPDISLALTDPDGLLAAGGNLSEETLKLAYSKGIFPWFERGQPILWWSPSERAILYTDQIHVSKSMKKTIKQDNFTVKMDTNFSDVIAQCKSMTVNRQRTWITDDMETAYLKLFEKGIAHSVEVYHSNKLVGGLYGIFISNCFCGESMFSKEPNTSKFALIKLANLLKANGCNMIDCQLPSAHLLSMGAKVVAREYFIKQLNTIKKNSNLQNINWSKICRQ